MGNSLRLWYCPKFEFGLSTSTAVPWLMISVSDIHESPVLGSLKLLVPPQSMLMKSERLYIKWVSLKEKVKKVKNFDFIWSSYVQLKLNFCKFHTFFSFHSIWVMSYGGKKKKKTEKTKQRNKK